MAYTLNRRLAQLIDSNGQLLTGKIPNDYITSDHVADNTITSAMLHTSFTVSTSNLTAIDTDDVSEGSSNLYYTDARVGTYISGNRDYGNITTTGYIAGPATFTIDPAAVGDNTGTVVIAGNLQVDGTTTTINSTTMEVDDLNLTLASGAANAAAANGAGITVDGASATITYDGTNDEWDFNKDINVTGTITADGLTVDAGASDTVATFQSTDQFADLALTDSGGTSYIRQSNGSLILDADRANTSASSVALIKVDGSQVARFSSGGDISFYEDTGTTAKFFWDASAERLGIGTTLPGEELHIETIGGATAGIQLSTTGGTVDRDWKFIATAAEGTFFIQDATASVNRVAIDTSGNVGIATTDPVENLTVGATSSTAGFSLGWATSQVFLRYNNYFSGTTQVSDATKGSASVSLGRSSDGVITFNTAAAGAGTPTEAMRIDSSGRLLIGATSISQSRGNTATKALIKLASGESYVDIQASSTSANSDILFSDASGGNYGILGYQHSSDSMLIYTAAEERMRIDSSGNVGIGTGQNTPEGKLHVNDNTVIIGDASSGYATLNFHSATSNSGRYASIRKNYDSPYDMRIRASNSTGGVPLIFELANNQEAIKLDTEGLHFQKVDGQSITAKESIVMTIDADNNTASRVFQVNHGNGKSLLTLYDDYRADVGTLQYNSTRSAGATSAGSFTASAGDWVDVATIPYGRNVGTVKFWWDGLSAPASAHHGLMEFDIGSHYGTSYYYGWDSYINLKTSSAHNSFYISEARIISPGGGGATGYFQVKFAVAVSNGTFRSYVTSRDESCTIAPMTPAVNNSRSGTTIASLKMDADRGLTNNRLSLATSRDMHIGGGLTILSQHSFNAYSPAVTTGGNRIVFGNTRHNVGGRYSTSTGRFTAGTSGKYLFTFDVLMKPTNTAQYGRILFRVNDVGSTMEQYGDTLTYQADQPAYFALGLTAVISLDIGDFVEVYNAGQWETYGTQYGHFGGHLLG